MKLTVALPYTISLLFLVCFSGSCSTTPEAIHHQSHTIEIIGMKFQPAELTVNNGDTVIFVNKDLLTHNVTEENKGWSSTPLSANQSYKKVIKESSGYYCSFHPVMKGKLIVK